MRSKTQPLGMNSRLSVVLCTGVLAAAVSGVSPIAHGESLLRSPFDPPESVKSKRAAPGQKPLAKPVPVAARPKSTPKAVAATPAFPGEDEEPAAEEPGLPVAKAGPPAPASWPHGRFPTAFQRARVDRLWAWLKSRPARSAPTEAKTSLHVSPNKQNWLTEAYARNLVDASFATFMMADKLILAETLKRELGPDADRFYPKTVGLKAFLERNRLVDASGRLIVEPDAVEQALNDEFPYGFVVRPAVGVAPRETDRGLFAKSDQVISELYSGQSAIYAPESYRAPIRSHILGGVASGEAIVLQEDPLLRADAHRKLKMRRMPIARVHTYEARVVPGAAPERWIRDSELTVDQERRAGAFVAAMLGRLSNSLLTRQAWSVDVAVFDNGDLRVVDVVTNRGKRVAWSGYLEQPRVIGAYSRLWEESCGVEFQGLSGTVLRHNLANYFPYWGKRLEMAKSPWRTALALFPPWP